MYTQEEINVITLSSIPELSYGDKKFMLEELTPAECDFEKHEEKLIKTLTAGVYNKVKTLFHDDKFRGKALKELAKKGIKCVTYFSESYPETLKNISDPPILLYLALLPICRCGRRG